MERAVALEGMKTSIAGWRGWGTGLVAVGLIAYLAAAMFDPTIEGGGQSVVNLQGLSIQIMLLIAGSTSTVAGLICLAVSSVIRALRAITAISREGEESK